MTLFISNSDKSLVHHIGVFVGAAAFCGIFSTLYNYYGHGVTSFFMNWLFLWPLLGAIWYAVLLIFHAGPSRISKNAINAGVATITVYSMLRGIFEIANTSSPYLIVFFFVGILWLLLGIFFLAIRKSQQI